MKLTARLLWIASAISLVGSFLLSISGHQSLSSLLVVLCLIAVPTGLIVYCIGQATEVVLDRIDRATASVTAQRTELEPVD